MLLRQMIIVMRGLPGKVLHFNRIHMFMMIIGNIVEM